MNIRNLFKPNIGKMKAERDVNGLIDALKYKKDWKIRKGKLEHEPYSNLLKNYGFLILIP